MLRFKPKKSFSLAMEFKISKNTCSIYGNNDYLCIMNHLKKEIEVELLEEAEEYFLTLNDKMQVKFLKAFDKTKSGLKGPWFEKLQTKEGIFEFRERNQDKFYRIFAFWYGDSESQTLILCTHRLDKKTNKTPKSEIEKAVKIKKEYFEDKKIKDEINKIIRTKR